MHEAGYRRRKDAYPNRWALRSDRAIASLQRGDRDDAAERLQAVLAWRARSGGAHGAHAKFEGAALAWALCRAAPGEATRSALDETLAPLAAFRGWTNWLADGWRDAG